jgi:hypothetical protein
MSLRLDLDADLDLRLENIGSGFFKAVFRIRIRICRICMFLGLPDPHPYPLRCSLVRIQILSSSHKSVERTEQWLQYKNFLAKNI